MAPIPKTGKLFLHAMRSKDMVAKFKFNMTLVDVRAPPGVVRATEDYFALERPGPSQTVLVITRSIPGPQEIEIHLQTEIYRNNTFGGSAFVKFFIFVSQYEF